MKNNNKILYISIAILVLAIGIAFGTYAYYQTTISGTISGNVAKWSFKANGQTSSLTIDMGDLYPGTSGAYDIVLSAKDSALDVYYELYFGYSNLSQYLYGDSAYTLSFDSCPIPSGRYGTIPAGEEITLTFYYNWPYGTSAESYWDWDIGSSIKIHIVGQQLTGYTGSTPMYILEDEYYIDSYQNGYMFKLCDA
ncbi:MAG: hypothetical protein IJB71_02755 [Bacilli bacterium]|nr:hypothetical protein [Bacilli bacterium]